MQQCICILYLLLTHSWTQHSTALLSFHRLQLTLSASVTADPPLWCGAATWRTAWIVLLLKQLCRDSPGRLACGLLVLFPRWCNHSPVSYVEDPRNGYWRELEKRKRFLVTAATELMNSLPVHSDKANERITFGGFLSMTQWKTPVFSLFDHVCTRRFEFKF